MIILLVIVFYVFNPKHQDSHKSQAVISRHFKNTLSEKETYRLSKADPLFVCCTSDSDYQYWQYRLLIFSIMKTYQKHGLPSPTILTLVSQDDDKNHDFQLKDEWGIM